MFAGTRLPAEWEQVAGRYRSCRACAPVGDRGRAGRVGRERCSGAWSSPIEGCGSARRRWYCTDVADLTFHLPHRLVYLRAIILSLFGFEDLPLFGKASLPTKFSEILLRILGSTEVPGFASLLRGKFVRYPPCSSGESPLPGNCLPLFRGEGSETFL